MIPEISLSNVLTPLKIDISPLIDQDSIFKQFDNNLKNHQVLHLTDSILKPEIKTLINNRGLIIEKIDVWRWNTDVERNGPPHTDGDYEKSKGRKAGLNWGLDNETGVEFYDVTFGNTQFESVSDGRTHTLWNFPKNVLPLITWKNKFPSLINTQIPHHIVGPVGSIRYSMTIKFLNNPGYDTILKKLWDLREDLDGWKVSIDNQDLDNIKEIVEEVESQMTIDNTGLHVGYNLPRDKRLLNIMEKFTNKRIKSFRIFSYKKNATLEICRQHKLNQQDPKHCHIDYDNFLKVSPKYALNIPLYGSNESYVDFYKNLGNTVEKFHTDAGSYLLPEDYTKVFFSSSIKLNVPYLIRTDIPHLVRIEDNVERKVLSIRFWDDNGMPSEILNNFIKE